MSKRRFRLPSPALVISMVTLSLVLGGTAVAATVSSDKKADTKLVKKLAPSLSVKHAKTADNATNATNATSASNATNATNATHATSATNATNATNATLLGGKTAASLETSAYTYTLPSISGVNVSSTNLPGLPAGIYHASYDITSTVDTGGQEVGCYFLQTATSTPMVLSYGAQYVGTDFVTSSGSGIVDTQAGTVTFDCFDSSGNFTVDTTPAPDVTFVPIDHLTTTAGTLGKAASSRTTATGGK